MFLRIYIIFLLFCITFNFYANAFYKDTKYFTVLKKLFYNDFNDNHLYNARQKRDITVNSTKINVACIVGSSVCGEKEFCETENNQQNGFCKCLYGYERIKNGTCVSTQNKLSNIKKDSDIENITKKDFLLKTFVTSNFTDGSSVGTVFPKTTPTPVILITTLPPIKKLVVEINNKTITLPKDVDKYNKWVRLSAYAVGDNNSTMTYNWELVKKPDEANEGFSTSTISQTISLKDLVPGIYIYKVTVHGNNSYGEAVGNVTVNLARHANIPPTAVIVPLNQTVKLPTSGVILDGSGSSDDSKVVSYQWELVLGPLGYSLKNDNAPTLQMTELVPGNYTVRLKVKDEAGLEGNATAFVIIVKETDYPPTANAGGDKIIFLPQSEVTLAGNLSSDDHGITEWEWTKGPEDSGNAVDMQDTRTPFLHLSHLERGHYHFILKVVDTAGHKSESAAHLYVHSPEDSDIKADAGKDINLMLPNTTAVLDGSKSTGIGAQAKIQWTQISGPTSAVLSNATSLSTNASALTVGTYVFQLTISHDINSKVKGEDNVTVTVVHGLNAAPVANAGGDVSVTLPVSVVALNGSASMDDVAVTRWCWQRHPSSLAAGSVIQKSDSHPVLLIIDLVAGLYVWNLTVHDEQGASSSDTVSLIVKESPHRLDEVEIVLGVSVEAVSAAQLSVLIQKLQLLLHNATVPVTLELVHMYGRTNQGQVSLILIGRRDDHVLRGPSLAKELRVNALASPYPHILNLPVVSVDTVVCQNNCSGHGECVQWTKECRCRSWWMESPWQRHMVADPRPNCDWSVVYVFVFTFLSVVGVLLLYLACSRAPKTLRRVRRSVSRAPQLPQQYSLLHSPNQKNAVDELQMQSSLLISCSDSDSDTEILFEPRPSSKSRNGIKTHKHRS